MSALAVDPIDIRTDLRSSQKRVRVAGLYGGYTFDFIVVGGPAGDMVALPGHRDPVPLEAFALYHRQRGRSATVFHMTGRVE